MLILVLLSTVLFTQSWKKIGADEEAASLLGPSEGESNDTKASTGKTSYGSITITTNGEAADLEYEAEQRKKDQERRKILEKRLEAGGNWFTYAPQPQTPLYHIKLSPSYLPTSVRSLTIRFVSSYTMGMELTLG